MLKINTALGAVRRLVVLPIVATSVAVAFASERLEIKSPDGRVALAFETGSEGLRWSLNRDGKELVATSRLGLAFVHSGLKARSPELAEMKVVQCRRNSSDTTWTTRLYRRGTVRDHYNELEVDLVEAESRAPKIGLGQTAFVKVPRKLTMVFRAYDEGAAFRYVVPEQEAFDGFEIRDELTEWRLPSSTEAWVTTYDQEANGQESVFEKRPLSSLSPDRFIGMPVVVETDGAAFALCEAALVNWAGLYYKVRKGTDGRARLVASLAKLPPTAAATAGSAVIATTPAKSPWRVILVGDDGLDLLRKNDIIVNLNPPPDPSIDFSFVKSGASSWDWWVESNNSLSTELTLKLVDFAAEMGWPYHTIDGGWYGFSRRPNHGPNVELKPRKDFDLERIVRHAAEKGVGIWVWMHWMEIEDVGVEETFARLEKWGVKGVKADFLSRQDQWIVNWYEKVCRAAAKHRVLVNFHGAFKPTGTERTWPNNLTREGILGNEFNLFQSSITPRHCATLPFTRFLLGPGDFTPGSFANVHSKDFIPQVKKGHRYGDETDRCEHWAEEMGTRAHALAQCIAFDSGLMTLCDWPERYRGAPGVEALRALPAAWKATTPIAGRCGEYYAVLRETHDGRFYFAATTVDPREVALNLDFLGDGEWSVHIYADDPEKTPSDAKALAVSERTVSARDGRMTFALLSEGGAVAIFSRKDRAPVELMNAGDHQMDILLENEDFRLTVGKDACVKSLVVKATGEECLDPSLARTVPLLTVTQDRPFDNELKLIHPNKRIVYPANRVRREGDLLVFGFAHGLYEATVRVKVAPRYIAFTLEDFPFKRKGSYTYLRMDIPRAASCRFLQLPVRGRKNFGNWLNACWDDRAVVCVAGASPHPDIDHEDRGGSKLLFAEALAGIRLRGASAALFAAPGREAFLDAMEAFEQDYGLPRGVKSRRSSLVKEPIFHLSGDYSLARTDEAIAFMRKGGFRLATMSFYNLFKSSASWGLCGDYDWRDDIPNGEADVRAMLEKFHAAGLYVGFHTLHSHIGLKSRYVTPVADPRLNKTRRFTLAAPIPSATNATEITVFEPTADVPMFEPCRILQFGGELMSYERCSAEPPYRFFGVKRGVHATRVTAHACGEIGGILDVSEYGLPMSCYVDQNTDLQDEVAAKLARAYNCGYDYVYLDGSEGVNAPFNYHVANAQYRYWKLLKREPLFGEAAAKTHFGWHMLAGANAFDTFPPEIFKKNLRAYPFKQAPITQQDMTRVDFGWWNFSLPRAPAGDKPGSMGTQADLWEYGVSVATAWDCAASILMRLDALKAHPRTDDIFATMKRWGDLRRSGKFREEWRDELKDVSREHHLLIDAKGEYDLVRYEQILAGDSERPVRAFAFEKDGANWVVYWHCTGEGRLWLPLVPEKVSLFDEFEGRPVAISAAEGGCVIPAAARLYLKSSLPRATLADAFRQSRLIP